jgi:hypothetical protein
MTTPITTDAAVTIDTVKAAAIAAGSRFFSTEALRRRSAFISTRVYVTANGVYFVSSENDGSDYGQRAYTVRYVANNNPARILTCGNFMGHKTIKAAYAAAAKRAASVTN